MTLANEFPRFPHFNALCVHNKYTSDMAAWLFPEYSGVSLLQVHKNLQNEKIKFDISVNSVARSNSRCHNAHCSGQDCSANYRRQNE